MYKVVVTSVSGTPPLIGTALLKGRNLNADWFVGGRVSLMPAAP